MELIRRVRTGLIIGGVGYLAYHVLNGQPKSPPEDFDDEDNGIDDGHEQMSKTDAQANILGFVAAGVGFAAQTGLLTKAASKMQQIGRDVKAKLTNPKEIMNGVEQIEEMARAKVHAPVAHSGGAAHEVPIKPPPKVTDRYGAAVEKPSVLSKKTKLKTVPDKPSWKSGESTGIVADHAEQLAVGVKQVQGGTKAAVEASEVVIQGSHAVGMSAEIAGRAGSSAARVALEGLGEGAGKVAKVIGKGGGKVMSAADGAFAVQLAAGVPTAITQTALGCYDDGGNTKLKQFGAATGLDFQGKRYSEANDSCQTATGKQLQQGLESATETLSNGTACFFSGRAFKNPGTCDAEHMTGGEHLAAGVVGWIPAAPTMAAGAVVALGDTVASQIHNAGVHPVEAAEHATTAAAHAASVAEHAVATVATNAARTTAARAASTYSAANHAVHTAEAATVAAASRTAHATVAAASVAARSVAHTTTHAVHSTQHALKETSHAVVHAITHPPCIPIPLIHRC